MASALTAPARALDLAPASPVARGLEAAAERTSKTRSAKPSDVKSLRSMSVTKLRGEADGRQVEGARLALAHLVGGGSVCTVNLLERA